jgi:hypothetical protein
MDACFQQFQDVLEPRGMSVETRWKRVIKTKMSTYMSSWTREILLQYPAITWRQFKTQLKVKYSPSEMDEKKASLNKLKTLELDECDTLEIFIEKFLTLKELAGVKETETLIYYLFHGLDIDLYSPVYLAISRFPLTEKTLNFAISQFRSAYCYIDCLNRISFCWSRAILRFSGVNHADDDLHVIHWVDYRAIVL